MDTEAIEKAISEGATAVQKLLQAEGDRRVAEAQRKWENALPEKVEAEITRRKEEEEKVTAERQAVTEEIQAALQGTSVDADVWADAFDVDGLLSLEGDGRTAAIKQRAEQLVTAIDSELKKRYNTDSPDSGVSTTEEVEFKNKLLGKT